MNKAIIVGRLTKAPDAKTTPAGISVTTFTVAVNRRLNKEETDFLNIITWRGLADICGKYLVQGQRVAVVGEIQTRTYEGKDGQKRFATEIHADEVEFLDRPQKTAASESPYGRSYKPAKKEEPQYNPEDLFSQAEGFPIQEDELPF